MAVYENSTLYYLLTDHLGSTAVTADAVGGKVAELRYLPYGSNRYSSGTTPTAYKFTGQRLDDSTGLYYYGARYYDPALGRFVQADTIVSDAPDTLLSALTVNFSNPAFLEESGRENRWRAHQGISQQQSSWPEEQPKGLGVVQWFQDPPGWARLNQTDDLSGASPSSNLQARGPADPQNLNRFTYVRNNPLRYVDPTGYWTFGLGFGFTVGLGGGLSGSAILVFDNKGNIGVAFGGGGGGYAGAGGSLGIMIQGTSAEVIQHLNGPVVQIGGSGGEGLSGGAEWVIQPGPVGAIQGLNINIGAGGGLAPLELHGVLEVTKVVQLATWQDIMNLFSELME